MTTGEPLPASSASPPKPKGRAQQTKRGPRGVRGRLQNQQRKESSAETSNSVQDGEGQQQPTNESLAFRPASIPPSPQSHTTDPEAERNTAGASEQNPESRQDKRGGRLRIQQRAGASRHVDGETQRQRPRPHKARAATHVAANRHFGGQLTSNQVGDGPSSTFSVLQGDAPEFRPGQVLSQYPTRKDHDQQHRPQSKSSTPAARRRRFSKSVAHDVATRTHEDISNGFYECPICTNEVARNSKIWSCRTCWTVFHLSCIKKWSQNEGSVHAQPQENEAPPPRMWRCPGCNLPKDTLPKLYTCWCEKDVEPRAFPGLPPHSCGQTCGKHRLVPKKCPHPCELMCHAGPCPPCTHVGPTQSCYCGKDSTSRRCVDTDYEHGWSCGQICGDIMPCGEHGCQRECHEGLCGGCEAQVDARCYCGKSHQIMQCYDQGDERKSRKAANEAGIKSVEVWTGSFMCKSPCGRTFDCGKHSCEKDCHPQELEPEQCPRSSDLVSHCPCGKTPLMDILKQPRTSCEDPIPNCKQACLRKLLCGHLCQQVCHSGQCKPCLRTVSIKCRCGRSSSQTMCHQGFEEVPQCTRTCRVTLNCGRHECGERCCTGERRAAERTASKRKPRLLGSAPRALDDGFEAEHICTRICGRKLKCGNHTCQELCHRGPCGSCREAIFDEISCNCGRTVLQPPLPCGSRSPPCRFSCERRKNCGHSQVPHNCHGDEEACPKCPFLMQKNCMCGKKTLKNQPCWLNDARCGEVCERMLRCGSHFCRKSCHRSGECEDTNGQCQQPCGKAKKACGHPCGDQCHAPYSCREEKPCSQKILITCECQRTKQETRCNACKTGEGNTQKTLKCDDECARLERNRKIALALEIDPATHKDDHVPYSQDTLKLFQENSKWAQTQERLLRAFSNDDSEKRLRLKPMPPHQRAFLRSLAEDYGFDSESMDPEPHRHVAIFKTPRFVMAPMKTLSQCVEINIGATTATELQKRSAAAATASSNNIDTPFNSFLLGNPRFGLTVEELQSTLAPVLASRLNIPHALSINFLPSEEIVLKPTFNTDLTTSTLNAPTSPSIESLLRNQVSHLKSVTTSPPNQLATSLQLCHVDASFNVLRREVDASSAGGWSQVAAKAAWGHVPPRAPEPRRVGGGTVFTMLGKIGKGSEAAKKTKKAKVTEPVVEDWERAEEEEERMEETDKRRSSSPGDDTEDRVGGTTTGDDEEKGGVADAAIPSTIGQ